MKTGEKIFWIAIPVLVAIVLVIVFFSLKRDNEEEVKDIVNEVKKEDSVVKKKLDRYDTLTRPEKVALWKYIIVRCPAFAAQIRAEAERYGMPYEQRVIYEIEWQIERGRNPKTRLKEVCADVLSNI